MFHGSMLSQERIRKERIEVYKPFFYELLEINTTEKDMIINYNHHRKMQ